MKLFVHHYHIPPGRIAPSTECDAPHVHCITLIQNSHHRNIVIGMIRCFRMTSKKWYVQGVPYTRMRRTSKLCEVENLQFMVLNCLASKESILPIKPSAIPRTRVPHKFRERYNINENFTILNRIEYFGKSPVKKLLQIRLQFLCINLIPNLIKWT